MDDSTPEIPPGLFDSVETGEPFRHCIHCECDLTQTGRPYLVTKEMTNGDCVLEYAICDHCREEISQELSAESRQQVQQMLENDIDWDGRFTRTSGSTDLNEWIGNCLFCGSARDEQRGYGLSGIFLGGRILPGPFPAIICGDCAERIQQQLSKKTRDFWDRFSHEHFPGPPADLIDLPSPTTLGIF